MVKSNFNFGGIQKLLFHSFKKIRWPTFFKNSEFCFLNLGWGDGMGEWNGRMEWANGMGRMEWGNKNKKNGMK